MEREIAKLCRKVVTEQSFADEADEAAPKRIEARDIETYNGVRKFTYGRAEKKNQVGVATGLAWTQAGGELLNIEALAVVGKGQQIKTGSLGDVMQESIQAAMTFVRSRASTLGIPEDFHERYDLHIHVPEGATPKDGPSAGIGMCTAVVSVLTGIPVAADLAMTGEITLRGQVLADRRTEGEASGRTPRGCIEGRDSRGERARPQGGSRQRQGGSRDSAGRVDGRGYRRRARTAPRALPRRVGLGAGPSGCRRKQ